jgi:hypothetical protein
MVLLCLLFAYKAGRGQNKSEFEIHLKSIDSTFVPGYLSDKPDSIVNANRAFVDYTIQHLLSKPSDKYFISNRNVLEKFQIVFSDSTRTEFIDTLKSGDICHVIIEVTNFIPEKHRIIKEEYVNVKINGKFPYGGVYGFPEKEISKFEILINGKTLKIPRKAFEDLYEPTLIDCPGCERKIEVCSSLDEQFIYIYIFGGNAADTYYSKLVFNKKKFLTRFVADYYSLSINGSFRSDFIGF